MASCCSGGVDAYGWAARHSSGLLSPFHFKRRETGEHDVRIKIKFCGICHTDLHRIKSQWSGSNYPMVPGHEIVGEVIELGAKVHRKKFKIGDDVGVGCMVGACLSCVECRNHLENYCPKRILTYNQTYYDGTPTYGGYSDHIVVLEHFVLQLPANLPPRTLAAVAPLLCAGITVYSAMKFYQLDKGNLHLGVVGLGGHGHLIVKFAKAFGHKVTVISRTSDKKEDAIDRLGADGYIDSGKADQLQAATNTMDGIMDTASGVHPVEPLVSLLKTHGKLIIIGVPPNPNELPSVSSLVSERKMVAGSTIGGIKETQEVLDFALSKNITADIELIPMNKVNCAMSRLEKGEVRYRFVIDVANSLIKKSC